MTMFTGGTDPEFFLRKAGQFVSAIPLVPGTKDNPVLLDNGSMLQHDNVALEFATPVTTNCLMFTESIKHTLNMVKQLLPNEVTLCATPSADFDLGELDHDEAKEAGCEPDFDAWKEGVKNKRTSFTDDQTLRSCGGHIHIGHILGEGTDFLLDDLGRQLTVKGCDCVHGLASVILDRTKEAIARKTLYGKAGSYRPTDYGVEYRTLSNFWLKSPESVKMIYNMTMNVLDLIKLDRMPKLIADLKPTEIVRVINTGDFENAVIMFKKHVMPLLPKETIDMFEVVNAHVDSYEMETEWGLRHASA